MEYAVVGAFCIVTIMGVLLVIVLVMGQRHIGELPAFDFLVGLTIGAVAGADIAAPSIEHGPNALAIVLWGLLQVARCPGGYLRRYLYCWQGCIPGGNAPLCP